MSEPTKAALKWWKRYLAGGCLEGPGDQKTTALAAFAAGQAEGEASRPASPTMLDIARRLRDEFPGVAVGFTPSVWAFKEGRLQCTVQIYSDETGIIDNCTSLDNAIARLRQARDGDANPADLPGAGMRIDLTTEAKQ